MVYDFHGHFEPYVGHLAPLKASPLDVGAENLTLNVVSTHIYSVINIQSDSSQVAVESLSGCRSI